VPVKICVLEPDFVSVMISLLEGKSEDRAREGVDVSRIRVVKGKRVRQKAVPTGIPASVTVPEPLSPSILWLTALLLTGLPSRCRVPVLPINTAVSGSAFVPTMGVPAVDNGCRARVGARPAH